MIEDAKNGNNDEVEEIEYSYAYITSVIELVIPWAACGLLGMDKHKAFVDVTGGDVGGLKLDTFKDTIQFFPTVLGVSFSWEDADGNSINPVLSEEKKYYPDSFVFLPSLWNKTPSPTK